MTRYMIPRTAHCEGGALAVAIAATVLSALALALSAGCIAATRVFLRRLLTALSEVPQDLIRAKATLTPEEEQKLREGFYEAIRRHR